MSWHVLISQECQSVWDGKLMKTGVPVLVFPQTALVPWFSHHTWYWMFIPWYFIGNLIHFHFRESEYLKIAYPKIRWFLIIFPIGHWLMVIPPFSQTHMQILTHLQTKELHHRSPAADVQQPLGTGLKGEIVTSRVPWSYPICLILGHHTTIWNAGFSHSNQGTKHQSSRILEGLWGIGNRKEPRSSGQRAGLETSGNIWKHLRMRTVKFFGKEHLTAWGTALIAPR